MIGVYEFSSTNQTKSLTNKRTVKIFSKSFKHASKWLIEIIFFFFQNKLKKKLPKILVLHRTVGVLFGFVEDVEILLHMVAPNIELVHNVFSDSALGDETST